MLTNKSESLAYRVNDACHITGIGRTSLYKLATEGKLRLVKVAGRTLVDAASLRALFATTTNGAA
jgi:excisionase family DNA binding protein